MAVKQPGTVFGNQSDVYKVLIVDDEESIHTTLKDLFNFWGFETISAFNAYDGLAHAMEYQPNLITLDLNMREINGYVMLKILKRVRQTHNIPVIIVSGNLDKKIMIDTHHAGAAKFVTKPFQHNVLLMRIIECIDNKIVKELALEQLLDSKKYKS